MTKVPTIGSSIAYQPTAFNARSNGLQQAHSNCACARCSETAAGNLRFGNASSFGNPGVYSFAASYPNAAGAAKNQAIANHLLREAGLQQTLVQPTYNSFSTRVLADYMRFGLNAGYHPAMVAQAATHMYNQQRVTANLGAEAVNMVQNTLNQLGYF